ncbi:uncharacterized protein PV09_03696 [Verruconis gallopava]|uniref:AAA+ ATPase domain-containing protein n=1 Tax=Verruconis gallopava TaxID=253628 RepID=A0A0D2AF90_9PEZI|nr:uncharacterized protein PV09_03696 [Verruconis gallopava]KIW05145.1 hypothetical protein PV09_03696 [Verruconis gallopava]
MTSSATESQSLIAAQPWETAKARFLDGLSESERFLFNSATLENLFYQSSGTFERFKNDSKLWRIQLKLQPLLDAVEEYGRALDVFSNTSSLVLGPLWGSLRVVIQLARGFGRYFERLMDIFAQIGDNLPRYRVYERLFPQHDRLLAALANAYLDIIIVCVDAKELFGKAKQSSVTWAVIGKVLWRTFEKKFFDEQLAQFQRHQALIEKEAGLSHMIEAKQSRELSKASQAAQEKSRRYARRRQLLSVLSTVDYAAQHQRLRHTRHPGTCNWLLRAEPFQSWLHEEHSSCFALYGIPGSGKTVLLASIAEELTPLLDEPHACLCYFYCDYADPQSLDLAVLVGTLVRQLLAKVEIPRDVEAQITTMCEQGITPPLHAVLDMLERVLKLYSTVLIVVDGIDELPRESQFAIVPAINSMLSVDTTLVKVLTSCRGEENDIRRALRGPKFYHVEILDSDLSHDIRVFVKDQVDERVKDGRLVLRSPGLKEEIINALSVGAKDMFLWVRFQLEDICEAVNDHQIRQTLFNLPKDLNETYARILKKIYKTGKNRFDIALRMIKWIRCAHRPMTIEELREAVSLDCDQARMDFDKLPSGDSLRLIQMCGNLAVLNRDDNTVRFAHHTVQQFLFDNDQWPSQVFDFPVNLPLSTCVTEAEIGELCLTYLTFSDFETQVVKRETVTIPTGSDLLNTFVYSQMPTASTWGKWAASAISGWTEVSVDSRPVMLDMTSMKRTRPALRGMYDKFKLLEYITHNWTMHVAPAIKLRGSSSDMTVQSKKFISKLEDVIFRRQFLIDIKPWESQTYRDELSDSDPQHLDLFRWIIDEDAIEFLNVLQRTYEQPLIQELCEHEVRSGRHPILRAVKAGASRVFTALILIALDEFGISGKKMATYPGPETLALICDHCSDSMFNSVRALLEHIVNQSRWGSEARDGLYALLKDAIDDGNARRIRFLIELGVCKNSTAGGDYPVTSELIEFVLSSKQAASLLTLISFLNGELEIQELFQTAVQNGHRDMAEIMLSHTQKWAGLRLAEAIENHDRDSFDQLIAAGTNVNKAWSLDGPALCLAVQAVSEPFLAKILTFDDLQIDVCDAQGNNFLHYVAVLDLDVASMNGGDVEDGIARHVLYNPGVLHALNKNGRTPLQVAESQRAYVATQFISGLHNEQAAVEDSSNTYEVLAHSPWMNPKTRKILSEGLDDSRNGPGRNKFGYDVHAQQ